MEKKKPNTKLYIGIFIVFIMVMSVFGFIGSYQSSKDPSFEYGEFTIYQSNQGFYIKINKNKVFFFYPPDQLEDIKLNPEITNTILNSKVVSITYNPLSEYKNTLGGIQYEFEMVLHKVFNIIVQRGLTNNTGYQLQNIQCKDATQFIPVIFFKQSQNAENTGYELNNSCIIINAEDDVEFLKLYNRLLYSLFGVIG